MKFVRQLAAAADLRITSEIPLTGIARYDADYNAELTTPGTQGIAVAILWNSSAKVVGITITGNIYTSEARNIEKLALKLFTTAFPGKQLERFVPVRGLIGA